MIQNMFVCGAFHVFLLYLLCVCVCFPLIIYSAHMCACICVCLSVSLCLCGFFELLSQHNMSISVILSLNLTLKHACNIHNCIFSIIVVVVVYRDWRKDSGALYMPLLFFLSFLGLLCVHLLRASIVF